MPEVVAGIDRQRIAEMVAADACVHIEALMTEIDIGCDQRTANKILRNESSEVIRFGSMLIKEVGEAVTITLGPNRAD